MSTVTLSKKEYESLKEKALRYEYLKQVLEGDIFSPPPTRDAKKIAREFAKSGKYNKNFLQSLEKGLKRSSYFRK